MYCQNCGKELEPNASFCRNCGKAVTFEEPRETEAGRQKEKGISNPVIITGMICATVIILAIAMMMFLSLSRNKNQAKHSEAPEEGASVDLPADKAAEIPTEIPAAEMKPQQELSDETEDVLKEQPERESLPFSTTNFYMELPGSWAGHYDVKKGENYYSYYNVENAEAGYGGVLFSITSYYSEDEWKDLPDYRFLAQKDGVYYVALFPTDVQFDMEDEENMQLYYEMKEDVETILDSFYLK